jgi:hypothetical protein
VVNEEYRGRRKWSRNKQAVATVIWISFLTAAVATMLFFAVLGRLRHRFLFFLVYRGRLLCHHGLAGSNCPET